VTLQTNYLAAVLLTERLLPLLSPGRIVHVASATHHMADLDPADLDLARGGYSDIAAYARSKLAMIGHALWLAERLRDSGTEVVSISPGVISTSLLHAMFGAGGAPTAHGGRSVVEAALSPQVESVQYIDDGRPVPPSDLARDPDFQRALHVPPGTPSVPRPAGPRDRRQRAVCQRVIRRMTATASAAAASVDRPWTVPSTAET
jgi:NAD(P)-dependent dehydrogenase (short-subunit alcohol dehydrogenase family)